MNKLIIHKNRAVFQACAFGAAGALLIGQPIQQYYEHGINEATMAVIAGFFFVAMAIWIYNQIEKINKIKDLKGWD